MLTLIKLRQVLNVLDHREYELKTSVDVIDELLDLGIDFHDYSVY